MAFGAASWFNQYSIGPWLVLAGFLVLLWMLFGWFGTVIRESEARLYNKKVDTSFRWSMSWFIFSEVMFFAAFFGALFYIRTIVVPGLGSDITGRYVWPGYVGQWPTVGPYFKEQFSPDGCDGDSAAQHHHPVNVGRNADARASRVEGGHRGPLKFWLFITIVLGFTFLGFQAYEYHHAYTEMNLRLTTGVYGSTFFMLTGCHGLHVTIGAIMLAVVFGRVLKGHFDAAHHFAFEAAAWYWHFVDVVWLLLFVLVYWLV
jgi:cytochrome c oxidase subunit 3